MFTISGHLIDLFSNSTYPAEVTVRDDKIISIEKKESVIAQYILPGFIDAHVHVESSMLVPTAFARIAVIHGTVATVSDPHEIANVCGKEGVQFMIDNSKQTLFKFFFGAPSCVPATFFETAGAVLDSKAVEELLKNDDIWYLAEVMNYPGVLHHDPEVIAKINTAKNIGKPIDGHAPGLKGKLAERYISAGITTDHECFTLEEALDKVASGMRIIIREGSAAKNFDTLIDLIRTHPDAVMFCSDDKHPDELALHHINHHVKRAIDKGYNIYDVLRAASVNPALHYRLPVGLLREGDPADFIVIDNPESFNVLKTFIKGELVAENGKSLLPAVRVTPINNFRAEKIKATDLLVPVQNNKSRLKVIEAIDGQLITNELTLDAKIQGGYVETNIAEDVLKIAVINRYEPSVPPAIAFIRNFGLKKGAIASTVAHDCHNIIVVGVDDGLMAEAVNALVESRGGICVAVDNNDVHCMPLPIAGLMTDQDGYEVAATYGKLDQMVKEKLGTNLKAPFMTLSFMALLVIPSLKLSDKGLFNGSSFEFTEVQVMA